MPPNPVEPFHVESNGNNDTIFKSPPGQVGNSNSSYYLKTCQSSLNLLAHIFIGAVVGIALVFSFTNGLPLGATRLHIVLCVIGYQLLMSQAILSMSPDNGWSGHLRLIDRKRAHWILQIMGSGLAIAGSFIKIADKSQHWTSEHGKFGLVSLVFTTVCLVNGLASLYAYEWKGFMPGNISKITHICFGIVAYCASCITLCYGFDKPFFRIWATNPLTITTIILTALFTFIVIINPAISFFNKTKRFIKK